MNQSGVQIILNGHDHAIEAEMTLSALIDSLGIERRLVAVAHNGEVVKRDTYDRITVRAGDQVEVVRMVGGG